MIICQNLTFIVLKNGETVFKGDAEISEVRAKRSKSGKMPKRNLSLQLQIEESPDNCDAKFELVPTVSCADGVVVEGMDEFIPFLVNPVVHLQLVCQEHCLRAGKWCFVDPSHQHDLLCLLVVNIVKQL